MTTNTQLFLLYTFKFEVGHTHVQLCGGIEVKQQEIIFVLSQDMPFDNQLIPNNEVTKQIDEPFGMTGVTLSDFDANGRLYKDAQGKAAVDLALNARASFRGMLNFTLNGSLIFEHGEPRVAAVSLNADQPLTLSNFVNSILGESWAWGDGVANHFALTSGSLYALKAPDGASSDYTFPYVTNHERPNEVVQLEPGYGASATVLIFGKPFAVLLEVKTTPGPDNNSITNRSTWIELNTTLLTPIDFEFITLTDPRIEICTKADDRYLRIATKLTILDTPITLSIAAIYKNSAFCGEVFVQLSNINLPVIGGSEEHDIALQINFEWAQQHFHITHIGGIPKLPHDFSGYFTSVLNEVNGAFKGGCAGLVSDWLKGASNTSISLGLAKGNSPTKQGENMLVPLTLTWTASAFGESISHDFSFNASFPVPKELSELPIALCLSVTNSAEDLAKEMLSDPYFYMLLSQEVAKRVGAKAAARMLCRALQKFGEEVAKQLANLVKNAIAQTLAEAAELAAVLTTVALAGLGKVIDSFMDLLEAVWDFITGQDNDEKAEAEKQLSNQISQVTDAMQIVRDKYEDARSRIAIDELLVNVDEQDNFIATWSKANISEELSGGLNLEFSLQLYSGDVGDEQGQPLSNPISTPLTHPAYTAPFNSISDAEHYRLNGKVNAVLTGLTFLQQETDNLLQGAINKLRNVDDSKAAQNAAIDLQSTLDWLRNINTIGIVSEPQWAKLNMPGYTTVGSSLIGINTLLDGT